MRSISQQEIQTSKFFVYFPPSEVLVVLCGVSSLYMMFPFVCFVCYAPNRNPARDLFFNRISDPSFLTVLTVPSIVSVLLRYDDTTRESTPAWTRLFDSCYVVDIWRYLHSASSSFTWNRWDGQFASCIDLVGCPYSWDSPVSPCDD